MKKNSISTRCSTVYIILTLALLAGCSKQAKEIRYFNAGEASFKSGAYDEAKIDYRKVLQLNPKNAAAFARLGQMWLEEGATVRAGFFLKRAEELAPNDLENRVRIARVYQFIGKSDDAKKELLSVLQQKPNDGDALLALTEIAFDPKGTGEVEVALHRFPENQTATYQLATANMALRRNDLHGAVAAVERALQLDPKSPQAHQTKGIVEILQQNPKGAGAEFKAASDLALPRSSFKVSYAEYLRQTGRVGPAKEFLQALVKNTPDFVSPWILLGQISFAARHYDQALTDLENVFARDSQNIEGRLLQSDIFLAQGQTDKAVAELTKLEQSYPGMPPVKFRMAQADLQQNKVAQAVTALDEAIAGNPDFTDAILLRAQLNLRTGHTAPAISALENVLQKQPGFKRAQLLLADAYRAAGRFADAAAIFQAQIKNAPNSESYLFLGIVQQQAQKLDEARHALEKALELAPENPVALDQLVGLDLQEKKYDEATRIVQDQVKKHPDAAVSYLLEARVLTAQEKWSEAETVVRKALQLDPNSGPGYDMLVRCYMATNQVPQAVQELRTMLTKEPRNESVLMTLATLQEKQKAFKDAVDSYEKLLALDPTFLPALNNLAYIYAEQFHQLDKAYELARKARSSAPESPAVADTLGWVVYKRGDYQQALPFLQEAAGKLHDKPEIAFHLGMAAYMMGKAGEARTAFQQALSSGQSFPSVAEAKRRLALLEETTTGSSSLTIEQLQGMLQQHPDDIGARTQLAEKYQEQRNFSAAAAAYEEALKTNPRLAQATLRLAELYAGPLADKQKALAFAQKARELVPTDPQVAGRVGHIAFDVGNFSWAYSLLQDSSRQLASDPTVLHDYAWAAYSLGKVDQAREVMEACLKTSPPPPIAADAQSFLTMTAATQTPSLLLSAKREVEETLAKHPPYVPALMAAARLEEQAGAREKAAGHYQEVLRRFPDFGPAQIQLGSLYAQDPSRAAEAYDLAVKAKRNLPTDPAAARLLGKLSYERKDYSRALQLFQESARQHPLDAAGLCYLGLAYQQLKQPAEAKEALAQALSEGLPADLSRKAQQSLLELNKK